LYAAIHAWLNEVAVAQNLVVVRTPAGAAGPLAIAIDKSGWKEIVGTIAGDDTIFVATHGATEARRVARQLTDLKERKRK
jgi:transcriptional regulator of arginine metabolism